MIYQKYETMMNISTQDIVHFYLFISFIYLYFI